MVKTVKKNQAKHAAEYASYFGKLCTEEARRQLIWFLEEKDLVLAKQVRDSVKAEFRMNPKLWS